VFIRELFEALGSRDIPYAVIGGVAVNLHGIPRMTYDVDIVVAMDEPSLRACREVLESLGLRCRLPLVLEELAPLDRRLELERDRNLRAITFTDPSNPLREVDVLVAPSRDPDGVSERAVVMQSGRTTVRVASVADIIAMKQLSGRPQDMADIAHLVRLGKGSPT
jgi:hypothetical protein